MSATSNEWLYKIDFREYLTDDTSQDAQLRAAKGIRAEIERLPIYESHSRIDDILQGLEHTAKINDSDSFNIVLDDLWDWCDQHRVWCTV